MKKKQVRWLHERINTLEKQLLKTLGIVHSIQTRQLRDLSAQKVDQAIRDGKLDEAKRAWAVEYCTNHPEIFAHEFLGEPSTNTQ